MGGHPAGAGAAPGLAVVAACALTAEYCAEGTDLAALLGDERVTYEADRVLLIRRAVALHTHGCMELDVQTLLQPYAS